MIVCIGCVIFFFKQKTAYEVRISDWSSDVCSSDLFEGLTPTMVVALGESGVRTLDDLADLAGAELRYIVSPGAEVKSLDAIAELEEERLESVLAGSPLGADEANEMNMHARAHWFGDEASAGNPAGTPDGAPDGHGEGAT